MAETPPPPPPAEAPKPATPMPEAAADTTPKKEISTPEQVNTALTEIGKKLFDQQDPRVGIVALARMAGEKNVNPLGAELRYEVVSHLQQDVLASETIKSITLDKPEKSAILDFLEQHPKELGLEAKTRFELQQIAQKVTVEQMVQMAERNEPLRKPFFDALLGEGHTPPTPADMLQTLSVATTLENQQLLINTVNPQQPEKKNNMAAIGGKLLKGGFVAFMVMQFCMGISQEANQSHH